MPDVVQSAERVKNGGKSETYRSSGFLEARRRRERTISIRKRRFDFGRGLVPHGGGRRARWRKSTDRRVNALDDSPRGGLRAGACG